MEHRIYFGNKPFIVTDEANRPAAPGFVTGNSLEMAELTSLIAAIEQPEIAGVLLTVNNVEAAIEALKKPLCFIQAAGGLVQSEKGNLLLIFRKGKWDLPKGKLDPGETLDVCAVREVEEETGLRDIVLKKPICRTYHTYYMERQHCLKESHWYLMQAPEQAHLTPQTEEDIEQAVWVAPAEIGPYLRNTHRSVADVLEMALPLL